MLRYHMTPPWARGWDARRRSTSYHAPAATRPRWFFRGAAAAALSIGAVMLPPRAASAAETGGTFSVVAWDSLTGELGVAVQSKAFSVGGAVPWAEAGVGAVATQAQTNRTFGPRALALMRLGHGAADAMERLLADDPDSRLRQLAIVDALGRTASHTGSGCSEWAGSVTGPGFVCQGNILAGEAVVRAMARAMSDTEGELSDRLMAALEAGQEAGGDRRGQQSAALLVVRPSTLRPDYIYRYVDLRVEDHPRPIAELRRVYEMARASDLAEAHAIFAQEYEGGDEPEELAMVERERALLGGILRDALRGDADPDQLNNLAWSVATHDLFLEEAEEAARRAAKARPKDANILDTLAEVYWRRGKAKEARETAARALALEPGSAYFRGQLERFGGG